jgi:site-specific recombinase XerD
VRCIDVPVLAQGASVTPKRRNRSGDAPTRIDLRLPGYSGGVGRMRDRFRIASGTRDQRVYDERVAMLRDLHLRAPSLLAALKAGRFTLTALHRAYRRGTPALRALVRKSRSTPLADAVARYLREHRTRDHDRLTRRLERFVAAQGAGATTAALRPEKLAAYLADLARVRQRAGEPAALSDATVNRHRAALYGFCSWGVRQRVLRQHPMAHGQVPKRAESEGRMPVFATEDYAAYFRVADARAADLRADAWVTDADPGPALVVALRLLFHAGCDVGELFTRRVEHVEFGAGDRVTRVVLRRTKTRGRYAERAVPLPNEVAARLRAHVALYRLERGDLLFGMVRRATLEKLHARVRVKIKRPDLRLKDLRHVAAQFWRYGGADLEQVREWLGHATIEQTRVYARFTPDDTFDAPPTEAAARLLTGAVGTLPLKQATTNR